jgi:hypothetical protein
MSQNGDDESLRELTIVKQQLLVTIIVMFVLFLINTALAMFYIYVALKTRGLW